MLNKEKFKKFWDYIVRWDKKWNELDKIGIDASYLMDDLCENLLEELFYQMFYEFPRGDVVKYRDGDSKISYYGILKKMYYDGVSFEEVYSWFNKEWN